jgi:hypothetical protein
MWDGEPEELAQVHNAIGFSFFNMGKYPDAVKEYKKVRLAPPGTERNCIRNTLGNSQESDCGLIFLLPRLWSCSLAMSLHGIT